MSALFVNQPEIYLDRPVISTSEITVPVIFDGFESKGINSFTLSIEVDPAICRCLRIEKKHWQTGEFTWFQNELSKKLVLVWYDVKDGFRLQSGKLCDLVFTVPSIQPLPLRFVSACEVTHSIFAVPGIIFTGITIGNESESIITNDEVEESKLVYDSTLDVLAKYQPGTPANDVIEKQNPTIIFEADPTSQIVKGIAIQIPAREDEIRQIENQLVNANKAIVNNDQLLVTVNEEIKKAEEKKYQLELEQVNTREEIQREILRQQQLEEERQIQVYLEYQKEIERSKQLQAEAQEALQAQMEQARYDYQRQLEAEKLRMQEAMKAQAEAALVNANLQTQLQAELLLAQKARETVQALQNEMQRPVNTSQQKTEEIQVTTSPAKSPQTNIVGIIILLAIIIIILK